MPKLPEDHPLSEGYADPETRRIRAERLRADEYPREFRRKWEEERARTFAQRQFFFVAEIADRLARNPRDLRIDPTIRQRVAGDLYEWMQTQQFRTGEVVMLSDDPPDFRAVKLPLPLADGYTVRLLPATMALVRDACRRYVEARKELPGAASLARELGSRTSPGPRAGKQTGKDVACQIALEILADDDRRPPAGYGRVVAIARLVNAELPQGYAEDSVASMIRRTVRDWERAHPQR